jgi:very-short-patch-repair endonuclease
VAPRARVPAQLKLGRFTLDDAKVAGVSPSSLRGRSWIRLGRGLYSWRETYSDPWRYFQALQRLIPSSAFAGRTAAWLHGLHHVDPRDPTEVVVPLRSGMRSRKALKVRRSDLAATEVVELHHVRATSIHRTLSDLCPRLTGVEALALLDSSLRLKLTDRPTLALSSSPAVRALAPLAEPAESPMETRLRWLLMQAGLPRPQVQVPIPGTRARADLYYPDARLIIEFDGGNHRDRLVEDNRRQNVLTSAGYVVLRFTASDIYNRPETIIAQIKGVFSARRPGRRHPARLAQLAPSPVR